jgi:hypothetical protein
MLSYTWLYCFDRKHTVLKQKSSEFKYQKITEKDRERHFSYFWQFAESQRFQMFLDVINYQEVPVWQ